jgi:hypothetical protein
MKLSCAGLTRASILLRKTMDCRVKPGNDDRVMSAVALVAQLR